jgi:transposase
MTDILDLPDWSVISSTLSDGSYTISAEYSVSLQACTKCGLIGKLYRHGHKVVAYRDSPIRGAHVQLEAKVQRYKCRECGGTSLQPLGGVEADRRMTKRCVEYIKTQCLRDTFTRLAEHIGCDEKTIRNIANDYVHYMNTQFKP